MNTPTGIHRTTLVKMLASYNSGAVIYNFVVKSSHIQEGFVFFLKWPFSHRKSKKKTVRSQIWAFLTPNQSPTTQITPKAMCTLAWNFPAFPCFWLSFFFSLNAKTPASHCPNFPNLFGGLLCSWMFTSQKVEEVPPFAADPGEKKKRLGL